VKINTDKEYLEKLINAIFKNEGYCPCKLDKKEENICPCKDFMENKICKCKLFIK